MEANCAGRVCAVMGLIATAAGLSFGSAGAADLLSGSVSITNNGPALSDITLGPVSGPTSGLIDLDGFHFTFTGDTITYTDGYTGSYSSVGPGGFNGFVLTFTGVPTITSVSLDPASQQAPILSSNADQVFLDFNGGAQVTGQTVTIAVTTSAIPEPAAWAMMLVGLSGIGATLRRARRGPAMVVA